MRKCMQDKCVFNSNIAGCRRCADCNSPSLFVADDCERCFACENKEGEKRWDDNETKNKEEEKIILKVK